MNELLEAFGLGPNGLIRLQDFLQQNGYLLLFLGAMAFIQLPAKQKA